MILEVLAVLLLAVAPAPVTSTHRVQPTASPTAIVQENAAAAVEPRVSEAEADAGPQQARPDGNETSMTLYLACYGAAVSTILAALTIWRTFFRRGRIGVSMTWHELATRQVLRVQFRNDGSRTLGIEEVRFKFRDEPSRSCAIPRDLFRDLAIVLDVDQRSRTYLLGDDHLFVRGARGNLVHAIQEGRTERIEVEATNAKNQSIRVPPFGQTATTVRGLRAVSVALQQAPWRRRGTA